MPTAVRDDDADPVPERVAVLEPVPDSGAVAVRVGGADTEWVELPELEREARIETVAEPDAVAVFVVNELREPVRVNIDVGDVDAEDETL